MTTPEKPVRAERGPPQRTQVDARHARKPHCRSPAMPPLVSALECLDAGDRWADQGDRARALRFYGRALNHFLGQELYVMAASVAQRMVERFPDVVRARGTLAVLSLAEGVRLLSAPVVRSAHGEFQRYLDAAREAREEKAAVRQLRRIAEVTESPIVREWISEYLALLGDAPGAEEVFLAAYEEREGIRPRCSLAGDQRVRWADVLLAPSRSRS